MDKINEEMQLNCTMEGVRKRMIFAHKEHVRNLELATGGKMWVLYRLHEDNVVKVRVSTNLMLSHDPQKLIDFCHREYGENIVFDDNYKSQRMETGLGPGIYIIKEIGIID